MCMYSDVLLAHKIFEFPMTFKYTYARMNDHHALFNVIVPLFFLMRVCVLSYKATEVATLVHMIGKPCHCPTQVAPPPNMQAIIWEYMLT